MQIAEIPYVGRLRDGALALILLGVLSAWTASRYVSTPD